LPLNGSHKLGFIELEPPHNLNLLDEISDELPGPEVPQLQSSIVRPAEQLGVIELQAGHRAIVSIQGVHAIAGLNVPHLKRPICVAADQDVFAKLKKPNKLAVS